MFVKWYQYVRVRVSDLNVTKKYQETISKNKALNGFDLGAVYPSKSSGSVRQASLQLIIQKLTSQEVKTGLNVQAVG
jgi:hypothetical protein